MNKRLYILLAILLSVLPLGVLAGDINPGQALQIARNFMKDRTFSFDQKMMDDEAAEHSFYIFNAKEEGFVIVSADDRTVKQVLGYSDKGSFDYNKAPEHVKAFLDDYTLQIRAIDEIPQTDGGAELDSYPTSVSPLLNNIAWDQDPPYNGQCPKVGSDYCLTGCVATAMAQVMYFWKWPAKGKGSISYEWNNKTLSCNFANSTYKWSSMTPTYNSSSKSAAKSAVALLMRDCGYSIYMNYGVNSSGAVTAYVADALKTYFDYDASTRYVDKAYYTSTNWNNLLRSELSAGRPVVYRGRGTGGHAFVCDGYDSSGYFHFNFGWSGWCNGYFLTSSLILPVGYNFNSYQGMIIGIRPNTAAPPVEVKSVKLNKSSVTIKDNETFQLEATITPSDATNRNVTWSSSNTSVATVTSGGLVRPGTTLGTATITCTSVGTPSKKATCKVTVKTSKIAVKSVKLNKGSVTIKDNETFQLTATVNPTDATDKSVTWSSSNTSVASVTAYGLVIPGTALGTATITCTSVGTPSKKATCKVTVKTSKIAVKSVKLNKGSVTIKDNETFQLTATVNPTDATNKSVTWSSSNTSVASVTAYGLVIPGTALGTATITCTSVGTPSKKATCKVTVKTSKIDVKSVKLNKTSQTMTAGTTFQLTPTVGPNDAYDKSVTWSSSNEAVATVDANGLVTAVSPGNATITCKSVYTPTKKATCRITVKKVITRGDIEDDSESFAEGTETVQQTFDVYNLQGKKVLSRVSSLDGLPKGMYIVNGKKIVKK